MNVGGENSWEALYSLLDSVIPDWNDEEEMSVTQHLSEPQRHHKDPEWWTQNEQR